MSENQCIFNDGKIKSRLIYKGKTKLGEPWFVGEYKEVADKNGEWMPWISGTAEYSQLTNQEKKWLELI